MRNYCFLLLIAIILLIAGNAQARSSAAMPSLADSTLCASSDIDEADEVPLDEDVSESVFVEVDTTMRSDFPAHDIYKIWDNNRVNPYNIRLVSKPDTTSINLAGYCHPMTNRITSDFGFRKSRHHYGIDIKLNVGDTVYCAFDGMVRIAQRSRTYGYFVVVRHYNGLETVYAHLSKLMVEPNQSVKAGDVVGKGGNTGRSTGPHLHYELRYLGVPINPNDIIDFSSNVTHCDTLHINAAHFEYIREIEKIRYWTVRKGHTLGYIAQKTGVPINTICRLNKITRKSIIRPGQKIRYT